ncbi:PspC domain-containing protein [Pseudarthrobacter sp. NPDC092424]|uniref:PspC domain-containing protein n=1 Tax=Pseudarthrobacter sp. NPDC092424 TaxID=3364415 RepID=UPI00381A3C42
MNPHTPSPDGNDSNDTPRADSGSSPGAGWPGTTGSGQTPPPPDPAPRSGATPPPGAAPRTDFFNWIRSHGVYRSDDRWIGGVSGGIAYRLGVDPLIIRGVFIVLTVFAGVGVLLYGLAWALLPEPDGRIHTQEAGAGRWSSGMTGALIATILGLTGLGGGVWGWNNQGFGGFLWTVVWVGGAIYLVYYLSQRNNGPRPALQPQAPVQAPMPTPGEAPSLPQPPGQSYGAQFAASQGYGTGRYGSGNHAAPDYTYNYTYTPPVHRPRPAGPDAPAVAIAAGLALLVGGGLKALDAADAVNLGLSANAVVWASAAAVFGLAILIAGARGRTAGILSLFAVVALVAGGISTVLGAGDRARFQEVDWTPITVEEAAEGFDITAGRGTIDLTDLDLDAPLPSDVVIPLDVTASNVTVVIPGNVPVDVQTDMTMGNLNEPGGRRGGTTQRESNYNTGEPGGHLVIEIDGAFSNVTIQEGN